MKKVMSFFCIFLTAFFSLFRSAPCFASTCSRAQSNMQSYQNYNHGYIPTCENCGQSPCECNPCAAANSCPPCGTVPPSGATPCNAAPCNNCNGNGCNSCNGNGSCDPCDPCAAVCGTQCGISIVAIGVALAAVIAAAAIIIASGNGSATHSR